MRNGALANGDTCDVAGRYREFHARPHSGEVIALNDYADAYATSVRVYFERRAVLSREKKKREGIMKCSSRLVANSNDKGRNGPVPLRYVRHHCQATRRPSSSLSSVVIAIADRKPKVRPLTGERTRVTHARHINATISGVPPGKHFACRADYSALDRSSLPSRPLCALYTLQPVPLHSRVDRATFCPPRLPFRKVTSAQPW